MKQPTKSYTAMRDTLDPAGRFWCYRETRKLTEEQAARYGGKIIETPEKTPKVFITITRADGSVDKLSWGDYLKKKYNEKRKLKNKEALK